MDGTHISAVRFNLLTTFTFLKNISRALY
jgi:hypothetical protein